jgi:hypothetical protein
MSIAWGIYNICSVSKARFSSVVRYKGAGILFNWTSDREYLFLVGPAKILRPHQHMRIEMDQFPKRFVCEVYITQWTMN